MAVKLQLTDIAKEVAEESNASVSDTYVILKNLFPVMLDELKKENLIQIDGFGCFKPKVGVHGYNFHTKERVDMPDKKSVKFQLGVTAKNFLNS